MNVRSRNHGPGLAVAAGLVCGALLAGGLAAQEPFPALDAYVSKAMADWKVQGERLSMRRGAWTAPLEFWNGSNFRWGTLPSAAVTSLFVRFDPTPDGKVSSLMFALGADTAFFNRKPTPAPRAAGTP